MNNFISLGSYSFEDRKRFVMPNNSYDNACLLIMSETSALVGLIKERDGRTSSWGVPGGRRNEYETSPIVTAIREFNEEVGGQGLLNFAKKRFDCYGRQRNGHWTVLVVLRVDNIRLYAGSKRHRDRELSAVGELHLNFRHLTPEQFMAKNVGAHYISPLWIAMEEIRDISPCLRHPNLFISFCVGFGYLRFE